MTCPGEPLTSLKRSRSGMINARGGRARCAFLIVHPETETTGLPGQLELQQKECGMDDREGSHAVFQIKYRMGVENRYKVLNGENDVNVASVIGSCRALIKARPDFFCTNMPGGRAC
jgi:hypothetical protein